MYILDHESTDGSTSGPGFVRVPVSHPVVDWGWHRDRLQEMQHNLIERYGLVLCTDVDENWGCQNRITEEEQFRKWFYEDSCSGVPIQVERIPDYWQGLM